jgi:short-subunit dehydrogenase
MLLLRFPDGAINAIRALVGVCMDSLAGKVVIITGASEGIGARLAALLARRGARLALAARDEVRLREAGGPDALVVPGDLTDPSVRADLIAKTLERWGQIDVLINNAGRGSYYKASATPIDEARALFDLNFFAPLALVQLAAPHLRRTRGTLANISSIAGEVSLPWLPVYSASKFALASITSTLRMELKRDGVHVMGVFPGYVATEFQSHAAGPVPPIVLKGKRFAISADQCAAAILHGIERRRRTVVTPRSGWLLVWANRLFPRLVEWQLGLI